MVLKFICKQCNKEYSKPNCFKNIKTTFCCKECRDKYYSNKHKNFKKNKFLIRDGYCLLNDYFKIDIEDIDRIKNLNCYISKTNFGYGSFMLDKKQILFHRWIMNCPRHLVVDHRNRDVSDNRKQNLNIVSRSKNQQNRNIQSNNKTGYVGIHKTEYGYRAGIKVGIKHIRKHFRTLQEAIQWRTQIEQELNYYKGGV